MKLTKEELARLFREQTGRSTAGRAECLSNEMMVRASAGDLTQSERAEVADHLSLCSECAGEYRVIRSLRARSNEADSAAAVSESQPGMERALPQTEQVRSWFPAIWRPAPLVTALAASLLVVSVALGAWVLSLRQESRRLASILAGQTAARDRLGDETRRQLSEAARRGEQSATEIAELRRQVDLFSQPQLNAPVIDLDPRNPVRGAPAQASRTVLIPPKTNVFTLILNVAGRPSFPDYSLEILDPSGASIWSGRGLQKSAFDNFRVAVPRTLLTGGQYQLTLYGLRGNRRELIESYRVRIQYQ